jgi:hypothetical protein
VQYRHDRLGDVVQNKIHRRALEKHLLKSKRRGSLRLNSLGRDSLCNLLLLESEALECKAEGVSVEILAQIHLSGCVDRECKAYSFNLRTKNMIVGISRYYLLHVMPMPAFQIQYPKGNTLKHRILLNPRVFLFTTVSSCSVEHLHS